MKRKKAMAIVMVAAMTVTMLAGCGSSASDTAATPAADSAATDTRADSTADTSADSGEVITLRVVDWESDEMNAAMQDAFDNVFSVAHPNIKVEIVEGSYSDYSQQMNAMITAGEAPDVFQLGYDQGCSFYKKNLLTDWTDKAAADSEFTGRRGNDGSRADEPDDAGDCQQRDSVVFGTIVQIAGSDRLDDRYQSGACVRFCWSAGAVSIVSAF